MVLRLGAEMSPLQRATAFLVVILFLVGGMCWLDTLDLTDDVLLPQALMYGLQAIEPEEEGRALLLSFVTGALVFWLVTAVGSSFHGPPSSHAYLVSLLSDRPLYQMLCTYRI